MVAAIMLSLRIPDFDAAIRTAVEPRLADRPVMVTTSFKPLGRVPATPPKSVYDHRVTVNVEDVAASRQGKIDEIKDTRKTNGFNSIFAVASIPTAMKLYMEFKRQIAQRKSGLRLATIFSLSVNEDDPEDALPDEDFDNNRLDQPSRDFLDAAIADYNTQFGTNYDTSAEKFQNYYKDLSLRVKNRDIDVQIRRRWRR